MCVCLGGRAIAQSISDGRIVIKRFFFVLCKEGEVLDWFSEESENFSN